MATTESTPGKRIVLIEHQDQDLIVGVLKTIGIEEQDIVLRAATVTQAREKLPMENPPFVPDLLFLNLDVGAQQSVAWLKEMRSREDSPYKEVPVIVLSSYDDFMYRSDIEAIPGTAYVRMPFKIHDLRDVVIAVLPKKE